MESPLGHFDVRRLAPPPVMPSRTGRWRALLAFLGGALGGAGVAMAGVAMQRAGLVELPPGRMLLVGAIAFFPSLWLHVLLHEAGHALAGLAAGKRAVGFGVGPWRFERGLSGWHARRGAAVQGIGGFALLLPQGERGAGRAADAAFLLGGPVANLAVAGLVVAASPWLPAIDALRAAAGGFVVAGLVLGLVNLVPFRSRGWSSDGLALWQLLRDSASARVARTHRTVAALAFQGVRPRDWPQDLVDVGWGDEALTPPERLGMALLRLHAALDRGDALHARGAALEVVELQAGSPDGLRQVAALALAAHAAIVEHDPALIGAWLERGAGGLLDTGAQRAWLAAEAAWWRDDAATARTELARAREALPRVHDAASHAMLEERLATLEARIDTAELAA